MLAVTKSGLHRLDYRRDFIHRRSQEFVLEGALFYGWGHSQPKVADVSLPSRLLGRKNIEIWSNFFC